MHSKYSALPREWGAIWDAPLRVARSEDGQPSHGQLRPESQIMVNRTDRQESQIMVDLTVRQSRKLWWTGQIESQIMVGRTDRQAGGDELKTLRHPI